MELKRIVKFEAERDPEFIRWISHTVGGENIRHCLQCGLCSGNCPLSLYMDYTPRRLMHLSREGFKEEVLTSNSIWLCTTCYNCMVQCPKNINLTHLMYALKQRAIEEKLYPKRFPIPVMARQFSRYGSQVRTHHRELVDCAGLYAHRCLASVRHEFPRAEALPHRPHGPEVGEN